MKTNLSLLWQSISQRTRGYLILGLGFFIIFALIAFGAGPIPALIVMTIVLALVLIVIGFIAILDSL